MRRFIYLDTDTLNSYIAQMYDGLIQTLEIESQTEDKKEVNAEISPSIGSDVNLRLFGKGINGKTEITFDKLIKTENNDVFKEVQTKIIHDNTFDYLIDYLKQNNCLDNNNEIGDFIEIEDDFYMMDLDYYKNLFDDKNFLEFIKNNEKEKINKEISQLEQKEIDENKENIKLIKIKYAGILKRKNQSFK